MPHISVDCAIFGFHDNQLKILLLKWKDGPWCLPGGFVKYEESIDDSAVRILGERTALEDIYLQQFYVFGDPKREKGKKIAPLRSWINRRFISIGYYALVAFSRVNPLPDFLSTECKWWDITSVPTLIYDHRKIMNLALDNLRLKLNDYPVGYNLLPRKFTMPELQRLYETILGRELDRRNFQKRMLAQGILVRLGERKTGGAHKAPYLYSFDRKKYEKALKLGFETRLIR